MGWYRTDFFKLLLFMNAHTSAYQIVIITQSICHVLMKPECSILRLVCGTFVSGFFM